MSLTPRVIALIGGLAAFLAVYAASAPAVPAEELAVSDRDEPPTVFNRYIRPALRNFLPQTPLASHVAARQANKLRELLVRSGNPWNVSDTEFVGLQMLGAVAGGLAGAMLAAVGVVPLKIAVGAGVFGGFLYPRMTYDGAVKRRRRETRRTLPEALDLLNVCLAAGMSVVPALAEVVGRMPPGVVRDELTRVRDEVQVGRPLDTALTDLARRAPSPEVEAFARSVVQASRLGANISDTLAAQSEAARSAYEADLDVRIGKLATTLFLPILLFILPCLLGVMLGPALVSVGGQL